MEIVVQITAFSDPGTVQARKHICMNGIQEYIGIMQESGYGMFTIPYQ